MAVVKKPSDVPKAKKHKHMKYLKMSLELLQILNPWYHYNLFIKDQLPFPTHRMKTVSTVTSIVHKVRTPDGQCATQISMFGPMMSTGQ